MQVNCIVRLEYCNAIIAVYFRWIAWYYVLHCIAFYFVLHCMVSFFTLYVWSIALYTRCITLYCIGCCIFLSRALHQALQRQLAQQGCHTQQPRKSEQHHKTTYSVNSGSTLTFTFQCSGNWQECHSNSGNHTLNRIPMHFYARQ